MLFAFGVIPIAFVAALPSPIHAKLFLTDHSLTVMEHAWPVLSAPTRSAQQAPWRGYEEFDTSAFDAFVREHQRPHVELARALWRVVDRCVASIGGDVTKRGESRGKETDAEPPASLSSSSLSSQSLLGESPLANTSFPGEMPNDIGDVNCSSGRASSNSCSRLNFRESKLLAAFDSSVAAAAVTAAKEASANARAKQLKLEAVVKKSVDAKKAAAVAAAAANAAVKTSTGFPHVKTRAKAMLDTFSPTENLHPSAASRYSAMVDRLPASWDLEAMKHGRHLFTHSFTMQERLRLRPACLPNVECPICHLKWEPNDTWTTHDRHLHHNHVENGMDGLGSGGTSGGDGYYCTQNDGSSNTNIGSNRRNNSKSSISSISSISEVENLRRSCLQGRLYAKYPFACPSYVHLPAISGDVGLGLSPAELRTKSAAPVLTSSSSTSPPLSSATTTIPSSSSSSPSSSSSSCPLLSRPHIMHYGDDDDDEDEDGTFNIHNDVYAVASAIATAVADYADARKRAGLLSAYAASLTASCSTANATPGTAAAAASSVSAADTATITGTTAAAAPPTTPECAVKRQQRVFPRLRDPNITRLANARYLATRDACRVDPVRF